VREYDLISDWVPSGDRSSSIGVREALSAVALASRAVRASSDLGCGNGRPITDALVNAGYRVVGLDSSRGMLERFRLNLPHTPAVRADSRACPFLDEVFDAAVSWACCFISRPRDQGEDVRCGVARPQNQAHPYLFLLRQKSLKSRRTIQASPGR
jgi:SAM-dependent methyltransferase